MLCYAGLAYAIVYVLGAALSSIARLPILNAANVVIGGAVGFAKGAVFSWAVLYVALLFLLPSDVLSDVHRSRLIADLQIPDAWLDVSHGDASAERRARIDEFRQRRRQHGRPARARFAVVDRPANRSATLR